MADGSTPNQNLVLPEIGASKGSWGTKLNQNFTKLDTLLKAGAGTFVARAGDTLTGFLILHANPTATGHAANKAYVDTQVATRVAKAGDTMTGMLTLPSTAPTNVNHATNKTYVDAQVATRVAKAGDTMTGMLTLPSTAPTGSNHATNKSYVDAQVATRLSQAQGDARYVNMNGPMNGSQNVNGALQLYNAASGTNDVAFRLHRSEGSDYSFSLYADGRVDSTGIIRSANRLVAGEPDIASAGGIGIILDRATTTGSITVQAHGGTAPPSAPAIRIAKGTDYTFRAQVDGSVYNATNTYAAISDARLKENITDASPQLDDIMKMRVVNFNLLTNPTKQIGMIAQEVQLVKPGLVDTGEDGFLAMKYSVLVPILVKAMQELNAKVDALSA